jgi:signal transduction protein with GAF and PtsI domain
MPNRKTTGDATQWIIWGGVLAAAILQSVLYVAVHYQAIEHSLGATLQLAVVWAVVLLLAFTASRRIDWLRRRLRQHQDVHLAALDQVAQLEAHNTLLQIVARSVDVSLAFQALATRIAGIVPCERVGLALLGQDGQQFQTYTARVVEEERRKRPRAEVVFGMDGTVLGAVVRSREPTIIGDMAEAAPDFLDANVLHTAGFKSALMVPLVSKGRAVGTLNVVSRAPQAYAPAHAEALRPIAEILAVAYVAQQLHVAVGRFKTMEAMSELTLSIATEINSALQTIIGHCDILEHDYPNPALQQDLAMVVRQAQRIAELLEKMRAAATDRLREVEASVHEVRIPSSPEAFGGGEGS